MASLSERSEQKRYEKLKKRTKVIRRLTVLVSAVAVIGFVIFYLCFQLNRTYSDVTTVTETERVDGNSVEYRNHNGNLLKYSKDGASEITASGEILWNGSYEFKNPYAVTCGDYVAIADIGSKQLVVFNGKDDGTELKVNATIEQIAVARQGVVAVVLEDDDEAQINIYNPYDATEQLIVSISTSTDSDGYPVAIALSEDGQKLVTSYVNITGGVISSSLNFYNFDNVGQNNVDRIVGSRSLGQEIIADIQFINSNTVCAFAEDGCRLYTMNETPEDVAEISVEQAIKSVCYNEFYVTLILENGNDVDNPCLVQVYNTKGKKVLEKAVDYEYENVEMGKKEILFYSGSACHILRVRGSEKLDCQFEEGIDYFFSSPNAGTYYVIDKESIHQVKLTGRKKGR